MYAGKSASRLARMALILLGLLAHGGCSSLPLPQTGFEDSSIAPINRVKAQGLVGRSPSLNFKDFENSESNEAITTLHGNSLLLRGGVGVTRQLGITIAAQSLIFIPNTLGLQYQFLGADDDARFTATASLQYAYSRFYDSRCFSANTPTVPCSNNKHMKGDLNTSVLGFAFGYQPTDTLRFVFNPQLAYFDGHYHLEKDDAAGNVVESTTFGLSGLRKSVSVTAAYTVWRKVAVLAAVQFIDDRWNDIPSHQSTSFYLGVSTAQEPN